MARKSKRSSRFTPSELRVIELVRRGWLNKQIAAELRISERTVKFHLQNVFKKLGVHDRRLIADALERKKNR